MEIIRTNNSQLANDKKLLYRLTKAAGKNVKDLEGSYLVRNWLLYSDVNQRGEPQDVLSILATNADGEMVKLQTISKTFQRDFLQIVDIMGDEQYSIDVVHGLTKAGRDFVTCELTFD
jgi:hypothetical protein